MPTTINQVQRPRRRTAASSPPRTRAISGRQRTTSLVHPRQLLAAGTRQHSRSRLRQALHFLLQMKFQDGLHLNLQIGPALLGMILGIVVAAWWPELKPLLNLL